MVKRWTVKRLEVSQKTTGFQPDQPRQMDLLLTQMEKTAGGACLESVCGMGWGRSGDRQS